MIEAADKGSKSMKRSQGEGLLQNDFGLSDVLMDMCAKYGTLVKGDLPRRLGPTHASSKPMPQLEPLTRQDESMTDCKGKEFSIRGMVLWAMP